MKQKSPKVAIIYDRVNKFGGAERLLLAIHNLFPDSPIYTLVHNPDTSTWTGDIKIIPTGLNRIPFLRSRHEFLGLIAPAAFETFSLDKFDLVLSVTSEAAKSVITKPETLHVCYCLTPTRYLWSATGQYLDNPGMGIVSPLVKSFLNKNIKWLQKRDLVLSSRPDKYIAISKTVQKRIKTHYQKESDIVYPPIDYRYWSKRTSARSSNHSYYLLVSRLVPYKKVDLVIKAFNSLPDRKLKIVGSGSEFKKLAALAGGNVTFEGQVSDQQLRNLYQGAVATITPQEEDFGLVPLESIAAGTPVITYFQGGGGETVKHGRTGIHFKHQTIKSLKRAIYQFEKIFDSYDSLKIGEYVKKFSTDQFQDDLSRLIDTYWRDHQKTLTKL